MNAYWVKTPKWLPKFFPKELVWRMPQEKTDAVYLTFDDGPHPEATTFALNQLKLYNAKATFFCIGKNVSCNAQIYQLLIDDGHTCANHTQHHLNGWKTNNHTYFNDIIKATKHIDTRMFRPPYGRIKISQAKRLLHSRKPWKIYMWDILSGDFDMNISPEECLQNVLQHITPGSIIVFHDSEKAFARMSYALPKVLEFCKSKNWKMKALPA